MKNDHMLSRLAEERPEGIAWAVKCAQNYVHHGGKIGFERCANLASTPKSRRRALRDAALQSAAMLLGDGKPCSQLVLWRALQRFEKEYWGPWSNLPAPPGYASSLDRSLWQAKRAGQVPATPQGLGVILRKIRN